ncbi:hypothetical protein BUALT_Bualt12G0058200 [Buddleja alternifolia]|uniref:Transmembrane protein n=1 Tax=Buddleja alternifolia TaxID=168488 RepID=A0AAV6WXG9_9LAMI|nr:hypothetical protein BUALT_Bualt12G0058200 [Buddleja alternifolia]
MSVALLETSFLSNPLTSTFKPHTRTVPIHVNKHVSVSCKHSPDEDNDYSRRSEKEWAKVALVAMAAGVLTLGSVDPAAAAKTGGRIGGQAFRSSAPPPRSSGPRMNNSRTNVYINPPVAPPLVGGYGYGFGAPYYGGWGWSPFSFFAPGPSVAVGVGGGFDLFFLFIVLGAVSAVVRRFFGPREDDNDEY